MTTVWRNASRTISPVTRSCAVTNDANRERSSIAAGEVRGRRDRGSNIACPRQGQTSPHRCLLCPESPVRALTRLPDDTCVADDLHGMLDAMAGEAGFADYEALTAHEPSQGGPTAAELTERLARSSALDPARGSRTTASDTVRLLRAIWSDTAGSPSACARVRRAMEQQLTRHRIASAFDADITVFTRRPPGGTAEPARIDSAVGQVARILIDQLRR